MHVSVLKVRMRVACLPSPYLWRGGGECERLSPHEHRAGVDVGGRLHAALGQDVVHPILPVQLHLEKERRRKITERMVSFTHRM